MRLLIDNLIGFIRCIATNDANFLVSWVHANILNAIFF